MSPTSSQEMRQIKAILTANASRRLLLHLLSSVAHAAISLVLMHFWMSWWSCQGNATLFVALSSFYVVIFAILFFTACAHFFFEKKSVDKLAQTMIATSFASAVLGAAGVIAVGIIMKSGGCYYAPSGALFVCTMIFLAGSVVINVTIFVLVRLHRIQLRVIEETLQGLTIMECEAKVKESTQFEASAINEVSQSSFPPVVPTKTTLVPPSAPLYPIHQLGSIASFESLSELTEKATNT